MIYVKGGDSGGVLEVVFFFFPPKPSHKSIPTQTHPELQIRVGQIESQKLWYQLDFISMEG